jgi:Tfp pilus assembly protein PilW
MDCTITITKKARARGIALIEMMMSVGVGGLVLSAVATEMFHTGRSFAALANYVDLDNSGRSALDKMSTEIRQANRLTSYSPTQLQFETVDATTGATNTLTYAYNSTGGTLQRTYAGQTTTLLREVSTNSLQFAMFQRNPVGGSVDQYPTTDPTTCKVVQLSWTCSRKILGKAANSESVQSAKIVIRKE